MGRRLSQEQESGSSPDGSTCLSGPQRLITAYVYSDSPYKAACMCWAVGGSWSTLTKLTQAGGKKMQKPDCFETSLLTSAPLCCSFCLRGCFASSLWYFSCILCRLQNLHLSVGYVCVCVCVCGWVFCTHACRLTECIGRCT